MPSLWKSFRSDERGAIAILMAFIGLLLIMLAGASYDIALALRIKSQLQRTADGAVVAAATKALSERGGLGPDKAEMETAATTFFSTNNTLKTKLVKVSRLDALYSPPETGGGGNTVTLTVVASMPTYFLRLINIPTLPIGVTAVSRRPEAGPLQLVLALDTTASMNDKPADGLSEDKKIKLLKDAASRLVNSLMTDRTKGLTSIGIVPFSNYVNVGVRNPVPNWLNVPPSWTWNIKNWCGKWSNPKIKDCVPGYYDCVVDGFMKTNGCYRNCIDQANNVCLDPKDISRTYVWRGCVGTRTAIDFPTDPVTNARATTTQDFGEVITQPVDFPYPGFLDGTSCANEIMDLQTDRQTVLDKLTSLTVGNDTFLPSGMVWGWNVLDPAEPYAAAMSDDNLVAVGGRRVLVLMTDGKSTLSPRVNAADPTKTDGTLYPNGSGSLTNAWKDGSKTSALILTLCQNIRNANIVLYTILFDVNDTVTQDLLEECVGEPNISPSVPVDERHYFEARNKDDLNNAFEAIGRQVMQLRIRE